MMAENTGREVQATLKWSNCSRRIYFSAIVFGSGCLATSAVLLSLLFAFRFRSCTDQSSCRWSAVSAKYCGGAAVVLFVLGGSILLVCHQRRQRQSAPQVVVSDIPVGDLEKSPAPILPYNHIPHCQPFVEAAFSDLPDYFSVVQNIDNFYPVGSWTEDLDVSDHQNLPPSYEQALKTSGLAAPVSEEDSISSKELPEI